MNDSQLPTSKQVLFCANPSAGRGSALATAAGLASSVRSLGLLAEVQTDLSQVSQTANQLHQEGRLQALVGIGGDGTIGELVNRTDPGVPVSIYPQGTENLLAKYVGNYADPQSFSQMLAEGATVQLDAGRASSAVSPEGEERSQRVFLLMASCGFDAAVVHHLHAQRRGRIHHLSYIKPIWQSIRSYQYPRLRVYCSDPGGQGSEQPQPLEHRWLFAFNLPCYARGLPLAPQASGTDGVLDYCGFGHGSLWRGLGYLLAVMRRRQQELKDCSVGRAARICVESETGVPCQLDGDPAGFTPLELEILPQRLTLVVPRATAQRLTAPEKTSSDSDLPT